MKKIEREAIKELTKKCRACSIKSGLEVVKSIEEFSKNPYGTERMLDCKDCVKARKAEQQRQRCKKYLHEPYVLRSARGLV